VLVLDAKSGKATVPQDKAGKPALHGEVKLPGKARTGVPAFQLMAERYLSDDTHPPQRRQPPVASRPTPSPGWRASLPMPPSSRLSSCPSHGPTAMARSTSR
jgi:hypothetical protein